MEPREFLSRVESDDRYRLLLPEENRAVVQHVPSGTAWSVDLSRVRESAWEELDAVLSGERPAALMMHISRVVGYFSRIENWNRSKIAELRDRHKGDYRL